MRSVQVTEKFLSSRSKQLKKARLFAFAIFDAAKAAKKPLLKKTEH